MPQDDDVDQNTLIDKAFSDYPELEQDLPPKIQPYLLSQREVFISCAQNFDPMVELNIGSKSLKIDALSDERFFQLLPGFLEVRLGSATLSVSKSDFTHLDQELLPEFGDKKAMCVTAQEMHRFLEEASQDEDYFLYLDHEDGTVKKLDIHYEGDGWYFMCWEFDETPTLHYELMVHRKKPE